MYALMQRKCFDNFNQNTVIKYFVHQILQVHLDVIISIQTQKHENTSMLVSISKDKYQRHLWMKQLDMVIVTIIAGKQDNCML